MNESDIENLLRKAPRPSPPAGLKEQLTAGINLPEASHRAASSEPVDAVPLWKRWFPALSFGLLLLGGLVVLGVQANQLLELRRENTALQADNANVGRLRADNTELQRLRAAAQQTERTRHDLEELTRLRAEVQRLRESAKELAALRSENERLQAQRAAAASAAGVPTEADPFAEGKARADRIACINNIKQIGLAARLWANDHNDTMPSDFLTMSNELNTPKILTCPGDTARNKANNWKEFDGSSVSYELLSPGVPEGDPEIVFVRCPIHFNVGLLDGSAQQLSATRVRVEKVDGKFKIVRIEKSTQP
jgi:hypothetical protein